MINIIKLRNIGYIFSGALIVAAVVVMFVFGLSFGIDFTGGSLLEVKLAADHQPNSAVEVTEVVQKAGVAGDVSTQLSGGNTAVIRMQEISNEQRDLVLNALTEKYIGAEEQRFDFIGPTIGDELRANSVYAVVAALVGIVLYLAYAFRKAGAEVSPWLFGVLAIVALVHDVVITLGVYVLLGKIFGAQIDTLFVTAILAVVGYSVNDTIVVFDRIRANLVHSAGGFTNLVNTSLNQTLTRSLNTSITTLLVLTALLIFGGASIQFFVATLILGIIIGTYSSVFIASSLLVTWKQIRGQLR